jgi:hypothetical protein
MDLNDHERDYPMLRLDTKWQHGALFTVLHYICIAMTDNSAQCIVLNNQKPYH